MSKPNPWVSAPRTSDAEFEKAIREFQNKGGEILQIPEGFKEDSRANSSTAVKLGSLHLKLRSLKKD
jgi:hypothetical protein